MRTSVASDSAVSHPPVLTDPPGWRQDPPGLGRSPEPFGSAPQTLRYDVTGGDAATTPVRVRLVDVTRGRRLAADDEGRHVSDDPLAWLDGSSSYGADA